MGTTRQIRGADWIRVATEQKRTALSRHGLFMLGATPVPATPGTYAFTTFAFWNAACPGVLAAARREGKDVRTDAPFPTDPIDGMIGGVSLLLTDAAKRAHAAGTDEIAVKQSLERIDGSLRVLLDAMAKGSVPGARNFQGVLCLTPVESARFWSAVATLGLDYSFLASSTSIPANEYWDAVKEGATDGLRDVGQVAGSALAAAGEGLGAATRGFFEGFGMVNTALLVGGAVVAVKVL